jgi:hypothetical protein
MRIIECKSAAKQPENSYSDFNRRTAIEMLRSADICEIVNNNFETVFFLTVVQPVSVKASAETCDSRHYDLILAQTAKHRQMSLEVGGVKFFTDHFHSSQSVTF